ncbi:TetR/AcrR family transcriptional regulator [Tomitella fengzijianii]|nr:TetR/AcrR family transcriptional regulator [Tomitella fengzijianii]
MVLEGDGGRDRGESERETFIRGARRRQLVECAIEVIAEVGLARASTVRIARRAGVSRGVLTYHFRDRGELIDQVIARVYELGAETLEPSLRVTTTPREFLLAFIGSSVEFYAAYPRHVAALHAVFAGFEDDAPTRGGDRRHIRELDRLGELLFEGQTRGEFRDFNVDVMARTIRQALDGALAHVVAGRPAQPYAAELQALFDAATRSAAPPSGEPHEAHDDPD